MNHKIKQITAALFAAACLIITPISQSLSYPSFTSLAADYNMDGQMGDFDYMVWNMNSTGSVEMSPNDDGTFKANWNGCENNLIFEGKKLSDKPDYSELECAVINYNLELTSVSEEGYKKDASTVIGGYATLTNKMCPGTAELFVHEHWIGNDILSSEGFVETVTIDGAEYDFYRYTYNYEDDLSTALGTIYNCLRRDGKLEADENDSASVSGTVDMKKFLNAWAGLGYDIGNVLSTGLYSMAYHTSGNISVNKNSLSFNNPIISEGIKGDLNNDGKINSFDVVCCRKLITEKLNSLFAGGDTITAADFDLDGENKINDLVLLTKYVCGQIKEFSKFIEKEPYYFGEWADNFKYELYQYDSSDKATMLYKGDGLFSADWECNDIVLFDTEPKAVKIEDYGTYSTDLTLNYSASYTCDGNSFIGGYGWFWEPLVEFFIVDGWTGARPLSDLEPINTITVNDAEYDIYTVDIKDKLNPRGKGDYTQYWSVRKENVVEDGIIDNAKINFTDHIKAWQKNDLDTGTTYSISTYVQAQEAKGQVDYSKVDFNIGYRIIV